MERLTGIEPAHAGVETQPPTIGISGAKLRPALQRARRYTTPGQVLTRSRGPSRNRTGHLRLTKAA